MTGDQLKTYYERLKRYFKSDIQALIHADDHKENVGCGPYLLVTCSAIDFLGNLHHAKRNLDENVSEGFKHYVTIFLTKVNRVYGLPDVPKLIYKIIRCGQVHEAIVKPGVYIGKRNNKDAHLKFLSISPERSKEIVPKWIYFDVRIFAEDFLDSLKYFEESFNSKGELERMAKKLQEHLDDIKEKFQNINPGIDVLNVNPSNFSELYNTTSATPYIEGGTYLKDNFADIISGD
jgi:hypothetical protein